MIFSALFSFLGGTAFRMIWGELSSWLNKKQDHAHEMERMQFQAKADSDQHERNLSSLRVQAELGVKTIQVQAESQISELETEGWLSAVKSTALVTGVKWVDSWNAAIRPGVATWAVLMLTLGEFALIAISDNVVQIAGAALGIYLADRTLFKRGK